MTIYLFLDLYSQKKLAIKNNSIHRLIYIYMKNYSPYF